VVPSISYFRLCCKSLSPTHGKVEEKRFLMYWENIVLICCLSFTNEIKIWCLRWNVMTHSVHKWTCCAFVFCVTEGFHCSVHGINRRQQNKLHIPLVRLSSIQRGVCYSSVKIFNQLPQNIFKYCNKIHPFKILLRDYLVKNAFYSIEELLSTCHNNVDT
jgi:hypothetical protein